MDQFHEFLTHLLGCGGMGVLLIGQILGTAGQSLEVAPHTPLLPMYLGPSSAVEFTMAFSTQDTRIPHRDGPSHVLVSGHPAGETALMTPAFVKSLKPL